jgi:hypothetical protein
VLLPTCQEGKKHEVQWAQKTLLQFYPLGCPRWTLPLSPTPCLSPTCSMSRMMLMVSSWRKVREQGRLLSCPDSCRGDRPSEAWAMLVLVA